MKMPCDERQPLFCSLALVNALLSGLKGVSRGVEAHAGCTALGSVRPRFFHGCGVGAAATVAGTPDQIDAVVMGFYMFKHLLNVHN